MVNATPPHALAALPRGRTTGKLTHCTGRWVDSKADLNAVEKRKSLAPTGIQTPNHHTRNESHIPVAFILNKQKVTCPDLCAERIHSTSLFEIRLNNSRLSDSPAVLLSLSLSLFFTTSYVTWSRLVLKRRR